MVQHMNVARLYEQAAASLERDEELSLSVTAQYANGEEKEIVVQVPPPPTLPGIHDPKIQLDPDARTRGLINPAEGVLAAFKRRKP